MTPLNLALPTVSSYVFVGRSCKPRLLPPPTSTQPIASVAHVACGARSDTAMVVQMLMLRSTAYPVHHQRVCTSQLYVSVATYIAIGLFGSSRNFTHQSSIRWSLYRAGMAASDAAGVAGVGVVAGGAGSAPVGGAASSDGSGGPGAAGLWAAAASLGDQSASQVAQLEQRKKELMAERNAVKRELKNEQRKRVRMMERARGLSDADLANILATRAAAKSKAAAKAKAKAKASA